MAQKRLKRVKGLDPRAEAHGFYALLHKACLFPPPYLLRGANNMRKFTYVTATSLAEVIPLLDHRTRPLAGGTDLVTQLKDHLISPDRLVSLRGLGLRGVAVRAGRLYIGALTTLSELERDPQLRSDPYRALAQAAHSAASPQLRNAATIGGNLLQDVRCPYYRGPFTCWLKGGTD